MVGVSFFFLVRDEKTPPSIGATMQRNGNSTIRNSLGKRRISRQCTINHGAILERLCCEDSFVANWGIKIKNGANRVPLDTLMCIAFCWCCAWNLHFIRSRWKIRCWVPLKRENRWTRMFDACCQFKHFSCSCTNFQFNSQNVNSYIRDHGCRLIYVCWRHKCFNDSFFSLDYHALTPFTHMLSIRGWRNRFNLLF